MPVFGSAHFDMNPKVREMLKYPQAGQGSEAAVIQAIHNMGVVIIDYYVEKWDVYFDLEYDPEISPFELNLAIQNELPVGFVFKITWFGME